MESIQELEKNAEKLAVNTAVEHWKEYSPEQKEHMLNVPESAYITSMKTDLETYVSSPHPIVSQEMKECARELLDYLNSEQSSNTGLRESIGRHTKEP